MTEIIQETIPTIEDELRSSITLHNPSELHWQDEGRCKEVDPELFYPEEGADTSFHAKKVCRSCEVRIQCLKYSLDNEEQHGVWGGLTPKDRRRFKKQGRKPELKDVQEWDQKEFNSRRERIARTKRW